MNAQEFYRAVCRKGMLPYPTPVFIEQEPSFAALIEPGKRLSRVARAHLSQRTDSSFQELATAVTDWTAALYAVTHPKPSGNFLEVERVYVGTVNSKPALIVTPFSENDEEEAKAKQGECDEG